MKWIKRAYKRVYSRYLYTSFKRIERIFRSALFAVLRCFYPSFHPMRMFGVAHGISSTKGKEIILPVEEEWILPKSVDSELPVRFYKQSKHTPGGTLAVIPGGFSMAGGATLTAKGELLSEFTEQFTARSIKDHKLFTFQLNRRFPRLSHFDTSVVSLVADCQNNYFHWLFDMLAKLCLFGKRQHLSRKTPARISHKHSSRFGQTVLSDDKESSAGKVKLTLPRVNLKSDGETGGQIDSSVGEKCWLELACSKGSCKNKLCVSGNSALQMRGANS